MKRMKRMTIHPLLRAALNALICMAATILLSLVGAKLTESGVIPIRAMQLCAYGIVAGSALAGCLLTALTAKGKRLLLTSLTGAAYFLLLCTVNGLLLRGEFHRLPGTAALTAGAVLLSALISAGKRRRPARM